MTTDRARPCVGRIGERRTIAKRSSNDDDGRASGSPAHSIGPGRCRSDSERPADDDGRGCVPARRGFQEICRQRSEDFPISVFAALLKKAEPSADGAFSRFERGFHGLLEPLSLISRRQEDPGLPPTTGNVLKASPAGAFSLSVSLRSVFRSAFPRIDASAPAQKKAEPSNDGAFSTFWVTVGNLLKNADLLCVSELAD